MNKDLIVFTTANVMEADLVKGLLEVNGIEVFMQDANICRIDPFLTNAVGAVKVIVRHDQLEQAKEILREYLSAEGGSLTPFDGLGRFLEGQADGPAGEELPENGGDEKK